MGDWSYFSIPIIKATLVLDSSDSIFEGSNGSNISAISLSSTSTIIFIVLGFDSLPHWSIATILIASSTGLNLFILNLPFSTFTIFPAIFINILSDLSVTFPSIS